MPAFRPPASLALVALAAIAVGCGSGDEQTPPACLTDASAYRTALQDAPGKVTLEGGISISDCLVPEQEGGELARVGEEMIAAATQLNGEARKDPMAEETVQLGYLVGAVERGSEGIHADLIRRLNAAARFSPGGAELLPAEFERTFGSGYAAGLESG